MRTIGIIGGMGPLATVDLYAKIVYAAQGKKDGDHVPVLLSGRPDIPDRAASICGTGPSALPALLAAGTGRSRRSVPGMQYGTFLL